MKSRVLDTFCVMLAACVVLLAWWQRQNPSNVSLLDRPRPQAEPADFVARFLETTQTPYRLQINFVQMEVNQATRDRLLQLLTGLHTAIAVNTENQRRLANDPNATVLLCAPKQDGGCQVLPAGSEKVPGDLELESDALWEQYEEVAAAVRCMEAQLPATEWRVSGKWGDWAMSWWGSNSETQAGANTDTEPTAPQAPATGPIAAQTVPKATPADNQAFAPAAEAKPASKPQIVVSQKVVPESTAETESADIELTEIENVPPK